MLYRSYKEKLEHRVRVLDKLWKFRFLLLAALVLLAALIVTLCAVAGNLYDQFCPASVEYGSPVGFRARAVFGSATAEYREKGTGEWSREQPTRVGEYEVRAVSEGVSGEKYGDVFTFSVLPRALDIQAAETFLYGEDPAVAASLAYADSLGDMAFSYRPLTGRTYEVEVQVRSVVNGAGEDVTDCYSIPLFTAEAEQLARPITLAPQSAQKVYDGTPLSAPGCELAGGTLAEGDRMEFAWGEITNAGTMDNLPSLTVYNAAGEDVTKWYAVEWRDATLTVLPREIVIHADSAQKMYDGAPLTAPSFQAEGELIAGHRLRVVADASLTLAGSVANLPELAVYDGEGRDVTANYSFRSGSGSLTVTPRPVTIRTASHTWVYQHGAGFMASAPGDYGVSEHSPYGLAEGDTLSPTPASVRENTLYDITDSETEVRYVDNALVFSVTSADGGNVTNCYDFSYEYGKLRVKTEIIVTFCGVELYYDGQPHSLTEEDYSVVRPPDVEVSCTFPARTDAGELWAEDFGEECVSATDPVTGRDVMSENLLRYEDGGMCVLRILPRPIGVTSISVSAEWNGEPLYGDAWNPAYWISFGSLAQGQYLEADVTGVLYPMQGTPAENVISRIVIYDLEGNDVTGNYNITVTTGWLQWRF